jgi:hypothetical protein
MSGKPEPCGAGRPVTELAPTSEITGLIVESDSMKINTQHVT